MQYRGMHGNRRDNGDAGCNMAVLTPDFDHVAGRPEVCGPMIPLCRSGVAQWRVAYFTYCLGSGPDTLWDTAGRY